ncbi:MAG: deoxyribose-phosphate aldolase [Bacteroidota bacterium]
MRTPENISELVDLTSLNAFDSPRRIAEFLTTAIDYSQRGFKVAAVCLYPNFGQQAVDRLKDTPIKTAVVGAHFPASQGFLSTRINECELALQAGVDEIDIVLNLGAFDMGDDQQVADEIRAIKGLMEHQQLKVILETGYLESEERIKRAASIAVEAGADFIKTSTGKEFPGATLDAAKIMAQVIKEHHKKTGKTVGLKISGGVRTQEQASTFIEAISAILGESYIHPSTFRIGASSLIKNLMKS